MTTKEITIRALKNEIRSLRQFDYFPTGIDKEIIFLTEQIDKLQRELEEKREIMLARNKEIRTIEDIIKDLEND